MTPHAHRLLTIRSASERTGIPVSTLHALVARGIMAEVRLPGAERRIWIREADLDQLIERNTTRRA